MGSIKAYAPVVSFLTFAIPAIVFAAPANLTELIFLLTDTLLLVIPVIFGLALVAILWTGAKLILHADNERERAENVNMLIWGIVILFVMVSIWGLVNLLKNTFFP